MTNFKRNITRLFACLLLTAVSAMAEAAPSWEKIASSSSEIIENVNSERIDVRVADRNIILSISSAAQVKVFTILGQLVAQQTLEPGVWKMSIPARGIYILKVGSVTRRVTI